MAVHRREKLAWTDLRPWQQRAIIVGGAIEMLGTAISLRDLSRRPAERVRGPKALWVGVMVIQPVGPIAYWRLGRR